MRQSQGEKASLKEASRGCCSGGYDADGRREEREDITLTSPSQCHVSFRRGDVQNQ